MDNNQFVGNPFQNQLGFNQFYGNQGVSACNCNGTNLNPNSCGCQGEPIMPTATMGVTENQTTRQDLQRNLSNYLGKQVTCEFCNCGNTTRKSGILSCVGNNFVTLNGNNGSCLLCDTAGLTFVSVCNER